MEDFRAYRRWLPHWRLKGAVYFVTWRCHPNAAELSPAERDLVLAALMFFDRKRYKLFAYVVMNDHAHALLQPLSGFELEKILHSWKSFTSNQINALRGETGPVWQKEYFDRIMRDEDEFFEKCWYILNNPQKRWAEVRDYKWVGWIKENFD